MLDFVYLQELAKGAMLDSVNLQELAKGAMLLSIHTILPGGDADFFVILQDLAKGAMVNFRPLEANKKYENDTNICKHIW